MSLTSYRTALPFAIQVSWTFKQLAIGRVILDLRQ